MQTAMHCRTTPSSPRTCQQWATRQTSPRCSGLRPRYESKQASCSSGARLASPTLHLQGLHQPLRCTAHARPLAHTCGRQHPSAAVQRCPDADAQRPALMAQHQKLGCTPSVIVAPAAAAQHSSRPHRRCRSATSSPPSATPRSR